MLVITVEVDAPEGQAIGIKEDLAMYLEGFGNTRVVSVEVVPDQQAMPQVIPEGNGIKKIREESQ